MCEKKPVTHVIFDVDGLLIDTEAIYTDIMHAVAKPYGKKFTWALKVKQMGQKQRDAAKIFIDELELPMTVDEYVAKVDELEEKLFGNTKLLPGVDKLVRHLHRKNIPIALATGSHSKEYGWKVANLQEFFSLFHHVVMASDDPDVVNGKPAPDVFLVAAKRFEDSPTPEKILVFEDAPNGAEGALAAGMQCVWVPDSHVDKQQLINRVHLTLDSLEQFKPEDFGLPPYES